MDKLFSSGLGIARKSSVFIVFLMSTSLLMALCRQSSAAASYLAHIFPTDNSVLDMKTYSCWEWVLNLSLCTVHQALMSSVRGYISNRSDLVGYTSSVATTQLYFLHA